MSLISKDLGAMKMSMLALAVALAASFAMVALSSNQRLQSEKHYRDQLSALQQARTRYQRSGNERETVMHYVQAYRQLEKIASSRLHATRRRTASSASVSPAR